MPRRHKASGTVTAHYGSSDGATKSSYLFSSEAQKPALPASAAASSAVPATRSIDYNAATRRLSIHDDTVTATPVPGDPILGAAIGYADYRFRGFNDVLGLARFDAADATPMTMALGADTLERSAMPWLFYDVGANLFYARITDTVLAGMAPDSVFYAPDLATLHSPFLDEIAAAMDPAVAGFDPDIGLFITFSPDRDFGALTSAFTVSGRGGATDLHFLSRVPEPGRMGLLALALAALAQRSVRRRQISGNSTVSSILRR